MESYRIDCYYEDGGVRKSIRRKFGDLQECAAWLAENNGVDVVGGSGVRRLPFIGHKVVRVTEEVVERYGEVCEG